MQIEKNKSLKAYNTFGIDVKAKQFAEFHSQDELKEILNHFHNEKNLLILGGGSNILFTKDFQGLVLKNSIGKIEIENETEEDVIVKAGGGVVWDDFVGYCVQHGFGGVENLSLIPGTVGAAPIQNIGAYGVELQDVFYSLEAFNIETTERKIFNRDECRFGYRNSVFKNELKNKYIIAVVRFHLSKIHKLNYTYTSLKNEIEMLDKNEITIEDIRNAVIKIRKSKLPDPNELGNAGSFFKNPELTKSEFEDVRDKHPEIPFYESGEKIKVPAGWLIEKAGLKGIRKGETGTYPKQALVIVNYGKADGGEIKNLAMFIKETVYDKFKIELNPEVNII